MAADKSNANGFLKEIEELRARAKAGDPEAQIEIARELFAAVRRGTITARDGNPDAFRWVRTAEINPATTEEQRLHLAEILLKDDKGNWTNPSPATFQKAHRLLSHAYKQGANDIRGKAARLLGEFYGRPFSSRGHQFRDIPQSFEWLHRAADAGNAMSALILGINYLDGLGVLENPEEGRKWLEKSKELCRETPDLATEISCQRVEESLGKRSAEQTRFQNARKTLREAESEVSVSEAMSTLRNLANNGYAPAMVLWSAEIYNTSQKKFYREAKTYLRDAVRQGYPEALAFAGRWLLAGGRGIRQNIKLARELLSRAAELGNVNALAHLCRCAIRGLGEPKNRAKARKLLGQAERQLKYQPLGSAYYEAYLHNLTLYDRANFVFLRKAAEKGDVRACFSLARRYGRGWRVPIDREEARKWFQKAAFRQHPLASYEVAGFTGTGPATPWLARAVSANSFQAGVSLGLGFLKGNAGIPRNWREAERLFRRFCPLLSSQSCTDEIITHFLDKPLSERSDRDRHFLERVRASLRNYEPTRAARLFRTEDPAFSAECESLAANMEKAQDDFDELLRGMENHLAKAESEWHSDEEEVRMGAEDLFDQQARYFLRPKGQRFFKYIKEQAEKKPEIREVFFRCFWRAVQKYLQQGPWTEDTQKTINQWIRWAFELYCHKHGDGRLWPAETDTYPPVLREAVSDCCGNVEKLERAGLSRENIFLVHEFGGHLRDERALTWLVQNGGGWAGMWVPIAAAAKIPIALRVQADRIPGDTKEKRELLREAAELGDPEAQCRQGEALLQEKKQDNWRQQAKEWFLKAAAKGHGRAAMQLGQLWAKESPEEAERYLKQVVEYPKADESLRTSAECELGKLFLLRKEWANAALHLKKAAQNDNCAAMELLALEPNLRETLSDDEIREWCLAWLDLPGTAGESNDRVLEYLGVKTVGEIGGRVLTRLGRVSKDKHESADWFRKAAEAGDGPGAYECARCLLYGDGCDRDYSEAENWLRKAWNILDGNSDLKAYASAWNDFLATLKEPQAAEVSVASEQEENLRDEVTTGAMDSGNG